MTNDTLEKATEFALRELDRAGGELDRLAGPVRNVALICCAQGVIDNGGLRYFFENDWPGQPPYVVFADAYRAIGADDVAVAIESAALDFPFPTPECDAPARNAFLERAGAERFEALEGRVESDAWVLLERYVVRHQGELDPE